MRDVQNSHDRRKIPIQKVGIKDLQYPITVMDRRNKSQATTALVNMYVDLPHRFRGTHMSRFIEVLNRHHGMISVREIDSILETMLSAFACETAHLEIRFPYFIERRAPVTGSAALMSYQCGFLASLRRRGGRSHLDLILEARVPVSMVCPCSKEISVRGAHNQRSIITMRVRCQELVWLEELIEIAEQAASAPVYSLLKRADEKKVTEDAYDHPRFAEDAVRTVAARLRADRRILWYQVESENFESIHNHNAYAMVEGHAQRKKGRSSSRRRRGDISRQ